MDKKGLIPWLVLLVSLGYYTLLSSKIFTWLFVSADSADWLVASNWWIVPQPLGSPLFILLGHGLNLLPGNQVIWMTVLLSCLPSAVTVTMVYLISLRLTQKVWVSITAAVVLLGSAVFLTQSTVLEEYALATMLLTLAVFWLIKSRLVLGFIFLGLTTAVHSTMLIITGVIILGLIYQRVVHKNNHPWLKLAATYFVFGVIPYGLILALMALPTPRLMAGGLDWYHVSNYFLGIGGGIVGTISVFDFPVRLLTFGQIIITSLGLALIPVAYGLKGLTQKLYLLTPVVFAAWYYLTCFDPGTWPFLMFGAPGLAVLCGLGLAKLSRLHTRLILVSALVLITTNAFLLNADRLAHDQPYATTYYQELQTLPAGSVIFSSPGAFYMTGLYAVSEGVPIIPIQWGVVETGFTDYKKYIQDTWGVSGNNLREQIQSAWDNGKSVYAAYAHPSEENLCFTKLSIPGNRFLGKVTSVTDYSPSYWNKEDKDER